MKNNGKRKVILSVVLVLFLLAATILGYRVTTYTIKTVKEQARLAKEQAELQRKEQAKKSFNNQFYSPVGYRVHFLNGIIDKLIDSNKQNAIHQVEFIYNGESCGTDAEKIQKAKEKLDNFKEYDVSFNYDTEGYIIQMMVVEQRETPKDFNFPFEHYAGTQPGAFLESFLTDIITHNTKNTKYPLEVMYNNKSYGTNPSELKKVKDKFQTFTKYEVTFEYDNDGYIIKVKIVTK